MNLPNKLSMFRVLLIPVFVVIYYIAGEQLMNGNVLNYAIAPIFIVASLTDFLDGYIARKNNLVTVFGKFIDPLADKLLVMAALLILNDSGIIPVWVTIVILSREFIVTGIRLVAMGEGDVIAASKLGKYKTASTMIALVLLLLLPVFSELELAGMIILYIGTALTVISGLDYFVKNKAAITKTI